VTSASTTRAEREYAWLEQRLDQWARWKRGGVLTGLGYGSLLGRYTKHDTPRATAIEYDNPAFDRMMLEVDRALQTLPAELGKVVRLYHDHANPDDALPTSEMARVCKCSIATLYRWRREAYRLIAKEVKL
jgi:hypothetical protein